MSFQPPRYGVYTPVVTFFNDDESIDLDSIAQHVRRLLTSGVSGLVIHGSNGEATHLSHEERFEVIRQVQVTAKQVNVKPVIIAGCSANSVRETLQFIAEAHKAGADYALVLPPNYWSAAMSKPVIKSFYVEVAEKSPLPIIIYNFPGVTANIDLDSDLIIDLARQCPNIVGAKLTCGNLGKLQRLSATLSASGFSPFAGKADFLLPGLVVGSRGVISALANLVPKVHVEVIRLYNGGEIQKAQRIQALLSLADWQLLKMGVSGVKAANVKWFGYGSPSARKPLPSVEIATMHADISSALQAVIDLEVQLPSTKL
ncbi:uncharacterized protein N7458_012829 [Penicillium daleae]|uniref:Dihydrodipicolinate synthase n=1 Tax=Penicillium daleae TaxID=63821 RepID=A0AAD6BWA0_9EURO|nr:uncharacterized protein N7458_012829 [Penicillium daleae]KAJ5433673.1 hypothetical protein N7458_012829 [Penicillium daleae]